MTKYNLDILKALDQNRATESWTKQKAQTFFANYFCAQPSFDELSNFVFSKMSLKSFYELLLKHGDSIYNRWHKLVLHQSEFKIVTDWSHSCMIDISNKFQNIELDFFDSFTSNKLIEEIQNGEWLPEKDQIVFNKNYVRVLGEEEYSVNFINPSLKSISRNGSIYIIHSYTDSPTEVVITLPSEGTFELATSTAKYNFKKNLRIKLRKPNDFVIRSNEALFETIFEIKELVEYEDANNSGIKKITFNPIKIKEDKDTLTLYVTGENANKGLIEYRLFNNRWSDWQKYEEQIRLFELSDVTIVNHIKPLPDYYGVGEFEINISLLSNNKLLFDPKQTTLLKNIDSPNAWTKGPVWEVSVYNKEDVVINLGSVPVIIDGIQRLGTVRIPKGLHQIRVDSRFIFPLVEGVEDIYAPSNVYHIFSGGFGYPKLFTTFEEAGKLSSAIDTMYSDDLKFKYSFMKENGAVKLLTKSYPNQFYNEQCLLILKRRYSEPFNFLQFRITFPRDFKGTLDSIGVSFR